MACQVQAALAVLPPTPAVDDLAGELGWAGRELPPVLDAMERSGLIERWTEPGPGGSVRVMLSAEALGRLGLTLAPRGDRWNPDRPPSEPARAVGLPRRSDRGTTRRIIAGSFGTDRT